MSIFTNWLETKVSELAVQISSHSVFDTNRPATTEELHELRTLCVLHRFLSQELERRTNGRSASVPPSPRMLLSSHAA